MLLIFPPVPNIVIWEYLAVCSLIQSFISVQIDSSTKLLISRTVPNSNDPDRIVFAHQKNIFGQTLYKFFGIFKTELSMTNSVHHYFKRISEQIDLNKYS